jgi:predicted nucleic acid-binding protein
MIVVDASVLVNVLADDGVDGDLARETLRVETDLAAPDLIDVETAAVLRKRWLRKDLGLDRFRRSMADLADLQIIRYPAVPFMSRVFQLCSNVTPYDAVYVALAEELGCALLTSDIRLAAATGPRCEMRVLRSP